MSHKIMREVRVALRTGQIKLTGNAAVLDRLVLFVIADDCHADTRHASVGMAELSEITGAHRTTLWRSVKRLEAAGCIRVVEVGRRAGVRGKASVYEIPEGFPCCSSATLEPDAQCSNSATLEGGSQCCT